MDVHLKPEQERFIVAGMRKGRFATPEDAVGEALIRLEKEDGVAEESATAERTPELTGQSIIAALQACPYPEIDLEPERLILPVREHEFEF